ncbi:hypothetical protein BS47DRAFT_852386 [Hydnum rufescens UP504]|uniref:Uncharacterized protein n=1 Tax=Hydnum rufescens UP504 TaxID=1448309 RepID=A0A9P6B9H8_9AGAM|nr:hypothetical protein BS47DRAFT_852386 [Hydnum rufescens UP504]
MEICWPSHFELPLHEWCYWICTSANDLTAIIVPRAGSWGRICPARPQAASSFEFEHAWDRRCRGLIVMVPSSQVFLPGDGVAREGRRLFAFYPVAVRIVTAANMTRPLLEEYFSHLRLHRPSRIAT